MGHDKKGSWIKAAILGFGVVLIFVSLSKWASSPETDAETFHIETSVPEPSRKPPLPPIISQKYKTCSLVLPTVNLISTNNTQLIDSSDAVFRVLFTNPEYVKGMKAGTKYLITFVVSHINRTTFIFADGGTCHRGPYQEHWRSFDNIQVFCLALFQTDAPLKANQVLLSSEFLESVKSWMKEAGYSDVDNLFKTLHDIPRPTDMQK